MRLVFLFAVIAINCCAQSPNLANNSPVALISGRTNLITFFGDHLSGATRLWTSFSATSSLSTNDAAQAVFNVWVPKEMSPGIGAVRVATTNGVSSLYLVFINDAPATIVETNNTTFASARPIPFPARAEGSCPDLGVQFFKFTVDRPRRISVEVVAQRLGSPLDPVIRLLDSNGKELCYSDDAPGLGGDSRFSCQLPRAGAYVIELRDIRYQGGPHYRYRLEIGEQERAPIAFLPLSTNLPALETIKLPEVSEREPNDTPGAATLIDLPCVINGTFGRSRDRDFYEFRAKKGNRLAFKGKTRSIGSPCDLFLRIYSTNGTVVAEADATGPGEGSLTHTFKEDGAYRLRVDELNHGGGPDFKYQIEIGPLQPGFTLAVDVDKVDAAGNGSFDLKVSATRRDFDDAIPLSIKSSEAGFVLTTNAVIPSKTNAATIHVMIPPQLQPGDLTHFRVVGRAKIEDRDVVVAANSTPALRALFPQMLYPPEQLDGLIALGVKSPSTPMTDKPAKKEPD